MPQFTRRSKQKYSFKVDLTLASAILISVSCLPSDVYLLIDGEVHNEDSILLPSTRMFSTTFEWCVSAVFPIFLSNCPIQWIPSEKGRCDPFSSSLAGTNAFANDYFAFVPLQHVLSHLDILCRLFSTAHVTRVSWIKSNGKSTLIIGLLI